MYEKIRTVLLVGLAVGLSFAPGCSRAETPPVSMGQTPECINTACPLMDEEMLRPIPEYIVQFQGDNIALCCNECLDSWVEMTDAERKMIVAKIKSGTNAAPRTTMVDAENDN